MILRHCPKQYATIHQACSSKGTQEKVKGCKEKKKKCNEEKPRCDRCTERGLQCEYEAVKPRRRRRPSCVASTLSSDSESPRVDQGRWPFRLASPYNINTSVDTRSDIYKWDVDSEYQALPTDASPLGWQNGFDIDSDNEIEEVLRSKPLPTSTFVRSRSQYPDLAMIAPCPIVSPLLEFRAPVFMEFSDRKNRRALVDHFCNVLSHLIVFKEDTGNPFRQLVLPLSYEGSPVLNAIYALSSAHLEYRGIENRERSLDFHNQALQGLTKLIDQNDEARREEVLGAIMLLVYFEVLVQRGNSNIVNGHLKGAMTIMKSGPQISSPTGLFLKHAFRFYDVIAALSFGTAPHAETESTTTLFPFDAFDDVNSPLSSVDTLLGLSIDLWPIMNRLSHLLSFKKSFEIAIETGETINTTMSIDKPPSPLRQGNIHSKPSFFIRLSPILFVLIAALLATQSEWPRRWLISGAPILQFAILLGASNGYRVLPFTHLWPLFTTLNLVYAVSSTSWLLYWVFTSLMYPLIFITCTYQFPPVSHLVRTVLRSIIKAQPLHFIDDKIAFFDIPALEIDTEVDGLMVLRGITFSLPSLSFVVHGVEVGIKLSDDMELAIQTEEVRVKLFRSIEVGDCFANLKGGEFEMTFGKLEESTEDGDGDAVLVSDTPLLRAASRLDPSLPGDGEEGVTGDKTGKEKPKVKMTEAMTDGHRPNDSSSKKGMESVTKLPLSNDAATLRYRETLGFIKESNAIYQSRLHVKNRVTALPSDQYFSTEDTNSLRAAICALLHSTTSVPHPPSRSIKVTTLQNLSSLRVKRFFHGLPMLLRLLLNPIAYFHPVTIASITATSSGAWIEHMLVQKIFKSYPDRSADIRHLKERISAWLTDAYFAIEFGKFTGLVQVPFIPTYDITCLLKFDDVLAYRTLPKEVDLKQVVRLGGADATFTVPSYLLPHHEHLLPPIPSLLDKKTLAMQKEEADGIPAAIQKDQELEKADRDETAVKISVHASLPAIFDQELLDFTAALVKASKVVEMAKESEESDSENEEKGVKKLRSLSHKINEKVKEGVKRGMVDGVVNDRWIAKMVGKGMRRLERVRGDVGWVGDIPVQLAWYRDRGGKGEGEGKKLLP
ncbi:hypothetical protein B7494_g8538 [Chlorociboria aeruginascens]|nr:hypothetical protein B7494_g8538 [Chlorociboria aeruginascens]